MMSQKGFTLIEALVASMVSLVIPAALVAILTVSNRQLDKGASKMRLSQIATAVSEDIYRAGVSATWVYGRSQSGVTTTDCPSTALPLDYRSDGKGFAFCDETFKIIKAYSVKDTIGTRATLTSYDLAHGWQPVVFAGDTVKVSLNPENYTAGQISFREPGLFGIGALGAWAWMNIHFDMEISGQRLSLPVQMQSVVCRNAPSRMDMNPWD
jgi:type II secretory pathway pseudopilin PulG